MGTFNLSSHRARKACQLLDFPIPFPHYAISFTPSISNHSSRHLKPVTTRGNLKHCVFKKVCLSMTFWIESVGDLESDGHY